MARVTFMETTSAKISSLAKTNGQIIFTRDIPSIYLDTTTGTRIKFEEIVDVATESAREDILSPTAKYYYVTETSRLYRYKDGSWVAIGNKVHVDKTDSFSATASQTSFTLTRTPASDSNIGFFINGERYKKGEDYSISGNKITWLATNANGGFDMKAGFSIGVEYSYLL